MYGVFHWEATGHSGRKNNNLNLETGHWPVYGQIELLECARNLFAYSFAYKNIEYHYFFTSKYEIMNKQILY